MLEEKSELKKILDTLNLLKDTKQLSNNQTELIISHINTINEIEGIENVEDGRYVGKGTKVITVTDISKYDEGTFENLLATLSQQDFSFDSPKFVNTEKIQTINSEDRIKQGETVPSSNKRYCPLIPDTFPVNAGFILSSFKFTTSLG